MSCYEAWTSYSCVETCHRSADHVSTSVQGHPSTVHLVTEGSYQSWLEAQPSTRRTWLKRAGYDPKSRHVFHLPPLADTDAHEVLATVETLDAWEGAAALGWALDLYQFPRYKTREVKEDDGMPHTLLVNSSPEVAEASRLASAIYLARDLINTPAEDMTPAHLAAETRSLAAAHAGTRLSVHVGEDLLHPASFFPAVHAVGRAASCPPHLIDMWWEPAAVGPPAPTSPSPLPLLVLVGKGVTFDTGGLDLKPAAGMRLMKKDMGGAALMLGLAQLVMQEQLPVRLRVVIPAAENAVGPRAFRPGDVLATRSGLSVEVGNTDAEGRLLLADALAAAGEVAGEQAGGDPPTPPDLVIDAATLTGAARVALGAAIPAFFTDDEGVAAGLTAAAAAAGDPLWRLPLHAPYAAALRSPVADLLSCPEGGLGGAITAALFLKKFAPAASPWLHLDTMAWNLKGEPGRPEGGEALALRAMWAFLKQRYAA